jgi:hypothetical protein
MQTENQGVATNVALPDDELVKSLRALKKWGLAKKIFPIACVPGAFAALAIFGINEMIGVGIVGAGVIVVLSLIVFLNANKQVKRLKDIVGSSIVLPILREAFEVASYSPNSYMPIGIVSAAGLVDDWDRSEGSDYFEGRYKGINIQYSDLHLQKKEVERDSDGNREVRYVTVFKGQWLVCDFGKELAASLRLIERKGGTKWNRVYDAGKSSVETENMEFNKKFRIITVDGHTAFYLLTPHFMERLMAADEAADASTLFCFRDGKVHIALNSGRDSFELGRTKIDNTDNVRQQFRRDLKYMTDIMDELLQNDKLFKEG